MKTRAMTIESNRNKNFDVIIIGAGVIGASVALGLSRNGYRTLNLDALPAAGYGSTSNSSGIIRPFYSALESCALAHEARNRWLNWPEFLVNPDESGYAKYVECGMLMLLAQGDMDLFQNSLNAMKEVGVSFENLSVAELRNRFPAFELDVFWTAQVTRRPGIWCCKQGSIDRRNFYIRGRLRK